MNICCGDDMFRERPVFSDVKVKVEEGLLKFDNKLGVFKYENVIQKKEKGEEIYNLDDKLEQLEKEKENYLIKIRDLDLKIKNLEKILLTDMKEKQYIEIIGQKTLENRRMKDY